MGGMWNLVGGEEIWERWFSFGRWWSGLLLCVRELSILRWDGSGLGIDSGVNVELVEDGSLWSFKEGYGRDVVLGILYG